MTKKEFVRCGLAAHPETKPKELAEQLTAEAVKAKLDFVVTPLNVSQEKSNMKKEAAAASNGTTDGATAKPDAVGVAEAFPTAQPDAVAAAKAVKKLVDQYGAETVAGLAALFAGK